MDLDGSVKKRVCLSVFLEEAVVLNKAYYDGDGEVLFDEYEA